ATMRAALADAARALPPPQPLPLAGLTGEIDSGPPTQIGRSPALFDQDAPLAPPVVVEEAPPKPKRRRAPGAVQWVSVAVAVAILLALVGGGIALAAVGSGGTVAVPSLVGLSTADATEAVSNAGLTLRIVRHNADDPAGAVIAQHPA